MLEYNRSYKFIDFFCVVYILQSIIILLAVSKTSAEAIKLRSPAPDFNKHIIVQPIVHHARTKREITSTKYKTGEHYSEVTIKVPMDDREFVLDLQLNKDLITDNHVLRYQEGGKTVTHKPKKEDIYLCQYSGTVRGMPGSWVAVSTCRGVRGVIYDGKQMRFIEPAEGDEIQSKHYVYHHSELNSVLHASEDVDEADDTGYLNRKTMKDEHRSRYKRSVTDAPIRGPFNANKNSRYVELVLVVDHGLYIKCQRNKYEVHSYVKDLVNIINSVYAPLNIFIALVGVEVWTQEDKIELSSNSSKTLENFDRYRSDKLNLHNDNAHLLTRQHFDEDVIGKAYHRAICTPRSVGIATNHSKVIGLVAMTIAHEMGHNFGMTHDVDCKCADRKCIMSNTSTSYIPTLWSSCSLTSLTLTFELGMDSCLRNKPKSLFGSPTCGNGFVEPGEQCDCGTMVHPRATNPCHACCQPDTCMLRRNATCGAGACCDLQTCRPRSAGTQCRAADRECDLPEYCTGDSEFCPDDVYKMDTTPCERSGERAYCTRGWCRSHLSQCQLLWGPTGQTAHQDCYNTQNVKGIKGANCGYDQQRQRYRNCSQQDAVCGLLHCQHLVKNIQPAINIWTYTIHIQYIARHRTIDQCHVIEAPSGSDWRLGLVPDGARCGGHDMICQDQRCVSLEDARATLGVRPCPSNCSGHGVCNSQGQCHCDAGFAPPLCELPGAGGSPDSGPTNDPTVMKYVMVAIYVTFLGILPAVLLIFLIYYCRRDLLSCWQRPRDSYARAVLCGWFPNCTNTKRTIRNSFQNTTSSLRRLLSYKSNAAKRENAECSLENADTNDRASKIIIEKIDTVSKIIGKNPTNVATSPISKINKMDIVLRGSNNEPVYENVVANTNIGVKLKIREKRITKINKDDIVHIGQSGSNEYNYSNIDIKSKKSLKPINKINKHNIHMGAESDNKTVNTDKETLTKINMKASISRNPIKIVGNDSIEIAGAKCDSQIPPKITLPVHLVKACPQVKPKILLTSDSVKAGPQAKSKITLASNSLITDPDFKSKTTPAGDSIKVGPETRSTIKPASDSVKSGSQIKTKPTAKPLADDSEYAQGKVADMRRMFDMRNGASGVKNGNVKVHGVKK